MTIRPAAAPKNRTVPRCWRMCAMAGSAIDDAPGVAHLRPAGAAVPAGAAAAIAMHHDVRADPDNALVDGAAGGGDHAARLVPGNDRTGRFAETVRRLAAGCAVGVRSLLHMPDALIATTTSCGRGAGSGIGELQPAFAEEVTPHMRLFLHCHCEEQRDAIF